MFLSISADSIRLPEHEMHCEMTSSCVTDETGTLMVRYGLEFKRLQETFRSLPDLSGNAGRVRELMSRINKYDLSPMHIDDVIEDFLASDAC